MHLCFVLVAVLFVRCASRAADIEAENYFSIVHGVKVDHAKCSGGFGIAPLPASSTGVTVVYPNVVGAPGNGTLSITVCGRGSVTVQVSARTRGDVGGGAAIKWQSPTGFDGCSDARYVCRRVHVSVAVSCLSGRLCVKMYRRCQMLRREGELGHRLVCV